MKRIVASILLIALVFSLCCCGKTSQSSGSMDSGLNSELTESPAEPASSAEVSNDSQDTEPDISFEVPDVSTIKSANQGDLIYIPESNELTASAEKMFVVSGTATSSLLKATDYKPQNLDIGAEVDVLALKDNMACILFSDNGGNITAGWVSRTALRYNDPHGNRGAIEACSHSGTPSDDTFKRLGLDKSITMPEEKNYIASYDKMYIAKSSADAVTFDGYNHSYPCVTLYAGDEVNVIAIQNKLGCISYMTDSGEKIGWVNLDVLSYNNPKGELEIVSAPDHTGTPSQNDIENLGLQKSMDLPHSGSYTAIYDKMYTIPASLPVYSFNESGYYNISCTLPSSSEVSVIAIQDKLACILFYSDEGEKAGWASIEMLSYNNPSKELQAVMAAIHSGTPDIGSIESTGMQKSMTLPKDEEYTSSYDKMYTTISSLQVFGYNTPDFRNVVCTLWKGSEVNVIAIRDKFACILYSSDEGEKCGWVALDALSYNDPTKSHGTVSAKDYSGTPSPDTLKALGVDKSLTLPKSENYLSIFEKMYVKEATVQVYSFNEDKRIINSCNLYSGSEVNVIAIQEKYALIVFETDEGQKAGWTALDALSYNDPSKKLQITEAPSRSGVPSLNVLESLGVDKSITLPESDTYTSSFEKMYISGAVTPLYTLSGNGINNQACTLAIGSEVNVIAIQKKYACILCMTDEGEKAGWVPMENLRFDNPNNKLSQTSVSTPSGSPGIKDIEALGQDKSMTLPDGSYLAQYEVLYVSSGSLPVYSYCESGMSYQSAALANGTQVVEIAKQKDYACILYSCDAGTKAGWVIASGLSETRK